MTLLAMLPSLCTNNLKGLGATLTVKLGALFVQPRLQFDDQRAATLLVHAQALPRSKTVDLTFDDEQDIDALNRLSRDRRLAEPQGKLYLLVTIDRTSRVASPGFLKGPLQRRGPFFD